ncbi:MAG: zf-HC2 domain-containing protein [Limnochordaceae bacterium]|nr:zf-HC2 domain-containing protein [Limnochordaceae bacterium]
MPGRHVDQWLPWYVNGTLGSRLRLRVERHLARCECCRQELRWWEAIRDAVVRQASAGPKTDIPPGSPPTARSPASASKRSWPVGAPRHPSPGPRTSRR